MNEFMREPWMSDALCAETDAEAFFPEKGGSNRDAKRTCMACDVRLQCLEYALRNEEHHGIWGGLSERERRRLVDKPARWSKFTPAEDATLARLVVAGMSDVAIGRAMGRADSSVTHRRNLLGLTATVQEEAHR